MRSVEPTAVLRPDGRRSEAPSRSMADRDQGSRQILEGKKVLWSVQYLRAVAALSVVLFHQAIPVFVAYGSHGVDIFFILSGFIMICLTEGCAISPKQFLFQRVARIVPLYWFATGLAFLLACFGFRIFGASTDLGLLLKSLLFVPAANADGRNWPTLYVGWTLDFEIFFYAVFAVVLLLPRCFRVVTLAIVFGGLVVFHATFRSGNLIVVTYTDPIILEFIIGIVIGTIFGADLKKRSLGTSVLMSAALLLATFLVGHVLSALSFACIATALVIVALLLERLGRLPRSVALKSIGDASFSIYLFQQFAFDGVFVLLTAAALITKLPLATGHWTRPVAVVSAVLFGLAAYRSIERALMHVTRRFVMPVQVRAAR